ncbi:hypothetical protein [Coralliovum pocilloporae]|uniref:hypothetical protein n=1 Tax=Coralliovum pocilloporae TaxID=3066369 RepID=UPI003307BA85
MIYLITITAVARSEKSEIVTPFINHDDEMHLAADQPVKLWLVKKRVNAYINGDS